MQLVLDCVIAFHSLVALFEELERRSFNLEWIHKSMIHELSANSHRSLSLSLCTMALHSHSVGCHASRSARAKKQLMIVMIEQTAVIERRACDRDLKEVL
jgi:hypothetical protein